MASFSGNKISKIAIDESVDEHQYSSDGSSDFGYEDSIKTSKTNSSRSSSRTIGRLPTRRPNPNVFNRNALMARENRRKKKEYVEMLENDIEEQRKINKKLQKIIKRQSEYVQALRNEKNYFKSILANKTQILSLVNLVRTASVSQSENSNSISLGSDKSSILSPNSSPVAQQLDACLTSDDNGDNGTVNNNFDPFLFPILDNSDIFSTDFNLEPLSDCNSWDNLLCDTPGTDSHSFGLFETSNERQQKLSNSIINDDHSYFNSTPKNTTDEEDELNDSGICLHISGGKFSLEFCAKCHDNSKKPFITDF